MSLEPLPVPPVPEETARIARAAFPHGNIYMQMRDELGLFYTDEQFADLFPSRGQQAFAPWRLALVTIMQYVENLSDQQEASAVRGRIDWKYALSLPLIDAGFDASILSEFRTRLIAGNAELRLLDLQLDCFRAKGWRNRKRQTANRFYPCPGESSGVESTLVHWSNDDLCA